MRLLITNDDGIEAPGLAALVAAASSLGEPIVVAPASPQSGVSHAMSDRSPLEVRPHEVAGAARAFSAAGRPADCTRLGLRHYAAGADWVLSGINAGGNLGVDVYYSGTVGAAREAAILGTPSVAVSQYIRRGESLDWERSARWTAHILRQILALPPQPGVFWNINLPQPQGPAPPAIHLAPLEAEPHKVDYHRHDQEGEVTVFHYRGSYQDRPSTPGSDVDVVFGGGISVTAMTLDTTLKPPPVLDLTPPPA